MTVHELIEELIKIPNQNHPIRLIHIGKRVQIIRVGNYDKQQTEGKKRRA